jgi:hypothetical protein
MAGQHARWELAITGGSPPVRLLRPAVLYRAPLPRTNVEASVADGLVTGVVDVDGHRVGVDGWRGTVGHNWGPEHAELLGVATRRRLRRRAGGLVGAGARQDQGRPGALTLDGDGSPRPWW